MSWNVMQYQNPTLWFDAEVKLQSVCIATHPLWKQVVINGATKEIGRAAVVAVTKARGMEVAGAVDTCHVGEDIGKVFAFGV